MRESLGHFLHQNIDVLAEEAKKDEHFLYELYGALCNTDWIRQVSDKDTFVSCLKGDNVYGTSWRGAGAICADIYNHAFPNKEPNDYLSYYCSGSEGRVSERVASIAARLGWKIVEYNGDLT
jgi:hypothetical protein